MSDSMTRGEMQDLLAKFAEDEAYRTALANDPKDIVARQFGMEIPDGVNVQAVQETADTMYVVIPHVAAEGAELGDADLERVAGGFKDYKASCNTGGSGALNTQTVLNL